MPTMVTPLDELEAVNELLGSIGQAPVSTLASSAAIGDVALARQYLNAAVRAIQLHGFSFNTDEGYTLSPNLDGLILVPAGVLKIKPSASANVNVKRRRHPNGSWAIWDADNSTWTFTAPVEFTIVWGYPFDDIPDTARHFATLSAARKFQKKLIGSDSLDGFNAEDEQKAWIVLQREERAARDTNLFRRNTTLAAQTANRRY